MTRARTRFFPFIGPQGIGGGLQTENPIMVDKNKMVVADNVLVSTSIARKKRGGQEKYHTGSFDLTPSFPASGQPINGLLEYWRTASLQGVPESDIFLHQQGKVWSIPARNQPGVDRTGALVITPDAVPCYQVFNQRLYFTSTEASDGYNVWDGIAATASAAVTPIDGPGRYICSHLGRMAMAGFPDAPFTVWLSSAFEPENWSTVNPNTATSLDLDNDGDPEGITGIASFQSRLYVWTRNSLYEITGTTPSDFFVRIVSRGIGAISHASIVQVPNDILFASDRGVHSLKQTSAGLQTESAFLSKDIQKLWVSLLNSAIYRRILGTFDPTTNCYLLTVPSSGQIKNDTLLVFNIEVGAWTVWPRIDARSVATALFNNRKQIITGKEDGRIGLLNTANIDDFGEGYTYNFKTGSLFMGDSTHMWKYKSITVLVSSTSPSSFSLNVDLDGRISRSTAVELGANADTLGGTFVLGNSRLGVGRFIPRTVTIEEIGYAIQVEIVCSGKSDLEVYGFIIEAEEVNESFNATNE